MPDAMRADRTSWPPWSTAWLAPTGTASGGGVPVWLQRPASWFIPTESTVDENLVAQAEVPEVTPVVADSTPAAPAVQHPVCVQRPRVTTEPTVVEEYVAEEVPAEQMEVEEPVVERQDKVMIEEAAVSEPAPIAQTESVETIAAPIVSVSNTSEQPVATAEERKPKRASIFKNIFRRHEPSKMDGTMLALNIL